MPAHLFTAGGVEPNDTYERRPLMGRKRMLSPEFFTSQALNALPIQTMVTFAGLWCYADDYGRGEDDATMVKASVWPRRRSMTEQRVAADLEKLAGAGLICRYAVHGFAILHMPSWYEHQQISHRGKEMLPPCSSHERGLWDFFLHDSGGPLDKFRKPSGVTPETFQANVVEVNSGKGSSSDVSRRAAEVRAALRGAS